MRRYVDLKVWSSLSSGETEPELMVKEAKDLGLWAIGLALESAEGLDEAMKGLKHLRRREYGVFLCAEIGTKNKNWKREMRGLENMVDFVSIRPSSLEYTRKASKAGADSIVLPTFPRRVFFDAVCARDLSAMGGAVEVHVTDLFKLGPLALARVLRVIGLEVQIAKKYRLPLIASSGAMTPGEILDPITLASVVESLFGLSHEASLNAISDYPLSLLQRRGSRA